MTTPTNLEVLENAMKTDTLDQVSPYHLDLYNRSVKHGLITPLQGQKPPTIPIPDKFDPNDVISDMLGDFDSMGDGYDYKTALKHGIVPDDKGKWQSLVPETGQILKGANHSTFDLTVEAERNRGSNIVYDGTGTLYSRSLGALRSDGTEKGTGFRGAHKMTDGSDRIVTDMTVEGGLIINDRNVEYPMLVPTLNDAEVEILMRGGDIPDSIRAKAIDHARMRIEGGMSPFANHSPSTQQKFSPLFAYDELSNDKHKDDGYVMALLKGLGIGFTVDLPEMVGQAIKFISFEKTPPEWFGQKLVDWAEATSKNVWGSEPEYEGFKRMWYEAAKMIPTMIGVGYPPIAGARIALSIGRLRKLQKTLWAVHKASKIKHQAAVDTLKGMGTKASPETIRQLSKAVASKKHAYLKITKKLNRALAYSNAFAIGSVSSVYGLSQGQSTVDIGMARIKKLEDQGNFEAADKIRSNLWLAAWGTAIAEGGLEVGSNYLMIRFLGLSGKSALPKGMKPSEYIRRHFYRMLGLTPAETLVEGAQTASAATIEKYSDIRPEARIIMEALHTMGTVPIMMAMLGGASAAVRGPRDLRKEGTLAQERKEIKDIEFADKERREFASNIRAKREAYGEKTEEELKVEAGARVPEDEKEGYDKKGTPHLLNKMTGMVLQDVAEVFGVDLKRIDFRNKSKAERKHMQSKMSEDEKAAVRFIESLEADIYKQGKGSAKEGYISYLMLDDIKNMNLEEMIEGYIAGREVREYAKVLEADPDDQDSLFAKGVSLYHEAKRMKDTDVRKKYKKFNEALRILEKAIKENPDNIAAHYNLALIYADEFQKGTLGGNRRRAVKAFQKVKELVKKERERKKEAGVKIDLDKKMDMMDEGASFYLDRKFKPFSQGAKEQADYKKKIVEKHKKETKKRKETKEDEQKVSDEAEAEAEKNIKEARIILEKVDAELENAEDELYNIKKKGGTSLSLENKIKDLKKESVRWHKELRKWTGIQAKINNAKEEKRRAEAAAEKKSGDEIQGLHDAIKNTDDPGKKAWHYTELARLEPKNKKKWWTLANKSITQSGKKGKSYFGLAAKASSMLYWEGEYQGAIDIIENIKRDFPDEAKEAKTSLDTMLRYAKRKRAAMGRDGLLKLTISQLMEVILETEIIRGAKIAQNEIYWPGKGKKGGKKQLADLAYLVHKLNKAPKIYMQAAIENLQAGITGMGIVEYKAEVKEAEGHIRYIITHEIYENPEQILLVRNAVADYLGVNVYADIDGHSQWRLNKRPYPNIINIEKLTTEEQISFFEIIDEVKKEESQKPGDESIFVALEMNGVIGSWVNMHKLYVRWKQRQAKILNYVAQEKSKPSYSAETKENEKASLPKNEEFRDRVSNSFLKKAGMELLEDEVTRSITKLSPDTLDKLQINSEDFPLFDVFMPDSDTNLIELINREITKHPVGDTTKKRNISALKRFHNILIEGGVGNKPLFKGIGIEKNEETGKVEWNMAQFFEFLNPTNESFDMLYKKYYLGTKTGQKSAAATGPIKRYFGWVFDLYGHSVTKRLKHIVIEKNAEGRGEKATKPRMPSLPDGQFDIMLTNMNAEIDSIDDQIKKAEAEAKGKKRGDEYQDTRMRRMRDKLVLRRNKVLLLVTGNTPVRPTISSRNLEYQNILSSTKDNHIPDTLSALLEAGGVGYIQVAEGKYAAENPTFISRRIEKEIIDALKELRDATSEYIREFGSIERIKERHGNLQILEGYDIPVQIFLHINEIGTTNDFKNPNLFTFSKKDKKTEQTKADKWVKEKNWISMEPKEPGQILNQSLLDHAMAGLIKEVYGVSEKAAREHIEKIITDIPANLLRHVFVQRLAQLGYTETAIVNVMGWSRTAVRDYFQQAAEPLKNKEKTRAREALAALFDENKDLKEFDPSVLEDSEVLKGVPHKLRAFGANKGIIAIGDGESGWWIVRHKELGYMLYADHILGSSNVEKIFHQFEDLGPAGSFPAEKYKAFLYALTGNSTRFQLAAQRDLSGKSYTPESFAKAKEKFLVFMESIGFDRNNISLNFVDNLVLIDDRLDRREALSQQGWSEEKINEAIKTNEPIFVTGKYEALDSGQQVITIGHGANAETVLEEIAHAFLQGGGKVKGVTDNLVLGNVFQEEQAAKKLARIWISAGMSSVKVSKKASRGMIKKTMGVALVRFNMEAYNTITRQALGIKATGGGVKIENYAIDFENIEASYQDLAGILNEKNSKEGGVTEEDANRIEGILRDLSSVPITKEKEEEIRRETATSIAYSSFLGNLLSKHYWGRRFLEFWNPLSTSPGYEFTKGVRTAMGGVLYKTDQLTDKAIKVFDMIVEEHGVGSLGEVWKYFENEDNHGNGSIQAIGNFRAGQIEWRTIIEEKFNKRDGYLKDEKEARAKAVEAEERGDEARERGDEEARAKAVIDKDTFIKKADIKKEEFDEINTEILETAFIGFEGVTIGTFAEKSLNIEPHEITLNHVIKQWGSIMDDFKKLYWVNDTIILNDSFKNMSTDTRKLLQQIKRMQVKLADMLVERNLITWETYWTYHGIYMHYLYLRDNVGGGDGLSMGREKIVTEGALDQKLGLLEHRANLIKEYRIRILQIKDPSFIVAKSMTETLKFIAKLDYVESLRGTGAVIQWNTIEGISDKVYKKDGVWWMDLDEDQQKFFEKTQIKKIRITRGKWFDSEEGRKWAKKNAVERHIITMVTSNEPVTKMGIGFLLQEISLMERAIDVAGDKKKLKGKQSLLNIEEANVYLKELNKLAEPIFKWEKEQGFDIRKEFQIIPTSWLGEVGGEFIAKPIYLDLKPILTRLEQESGDIAGVAIRGTALSIFLFKLGKAALNFPTGFRNIISNLLQNNLRGRPLQLVIHDWQKAFRAMVRGEDMITTIDGKKVNLLQEFHESGAGGKTQWSEEFRSLLGEYEHRWKESGRNYAQNWFSFMEFLVKISKYYGLIDVLAKYSIYRQLRTTGRLNALGLASGKPVSIREAADESQKYGMDYSLASRSIKQGRKFLLPFITYQYKASYLVYDAAIRRPWVLAKWVLLMWGGAGGWSLSRELSQLFTGMDDEEFDRQVRNLAWYVKEKRTYMPLPFLNAQGKIMYFDGSYFMPWGTIYNMFTDTSQHEWSEAFKGLGMGNPFLTAFHALTSRKKGKPATDPFTGMPIWNVTDTQPEKWNKISAWIENLVFPGMFENWHVPKATKRGAFPMSYDYLKHLVTGKEWKDKWGSIRGFEQLGRHIGLNTVVANYKQAKAMERARIKNLNAAMGKKIHSRKLSQEDIYKLRKRTREQVRKIKMERR